MLCTRGEIAKRRKRLIVFLSPVLLYLCAVLLLALVLVPSGCVAAEAKSGAQEQPPQALGSMTKVGGVFVNGNPASAAEATIFAGDTVRTAEDGVASFTVSGRGTLKIS